MAVDNLQRIHMVMGCLRSMVGYYLATPVNIFLMMNGEVVEIVQLIQLIQFMIMAH